MLRLLWLFVAGCGASQIAGDAASRAPKAAPPTLVRVGAWRFANDTTYYTRGSGFEVVVRHGLFNRLAVTVDNVDVPQTSGPPTETPPRTAYRVMDRSDNANQQTTEVRLHIYPKEAQVTPFDPPTDGTVRTYRFIETSINPSYTGTDKVSTPTELPLKHWNLTPRIVLFDVSPNPPATNRPLQIQWRADDVKQVDLLEMTLQGIPRPGTPFTDFRQRWSVLETHTFDNGPAGALEGTRELRVSTDVKAIMLRARSAGGIAEQREQYFDVAQDLPCPQNSNGHRKWFDFCMTCLGRPPEPLPQYACSEDEARQAAKDYVLGQNCKIDDGACFTP